MCPAASPCLRHGTTALTGPIRPLEPLGAGTLLLTPEALTFTPGAPGAFTPLTLPMRQIRSVTTERADTLQVATATGVWQFRPDTMSVFRLHWIVMDWAEPRLERPTHAS